MKYNSKKGTAWHCTSAEYKKCKAKALTQVFNGITMMKIVDPNHNHTVKAGKKMVSETEMLIDRALEVDLYYVCLTYT